MSLLAALLLAAQPAPAIAPERAMLDALRQACERPGDVEEMEADALAAGWERIADEAHPQVAKLNRIGRMAAGTDGTMAGASFRRTMAGRELFLIVSRHEDASGAWGAGCRLYDFAATAPLDGAVLEGWIGRPPTGVVTPSPGVSRRLWETGWRDGLTFEASHVPQGHEIGRVYGLSGNILVVQALGGF